MKPPPPPPPPSHRVRTPPVRKARPIAKSGSEAPVTVAVTVSSPPSDFPRGSLVKCK
eukprot:CAMPEP_0173407658 /NCGR_PEP_ID=MMETSP1356-20130122/67749_1 /TAXON_ID=77927 ORGANISM="Hemiselmis virescens, Strain PCC157" /NCGR_SAMPLE_ID=MMETSP1356 /ASSEMBLY_ACC=CAM_ASM_000847 /LENGTH=56 /DNA_ID=CAMNT_0014368867 /DNA_START=100 /DNA_END=270 /DNA_ORIENTATION=-